MSGIMYTPEKKKKEEEEEKGFFSSFQDSAKGFAADHLGQDQWASHSDTAIAEGLEKANQAVADQKKERTTQAEVKDAEKWQKNQRSGRGKWHSKISKKDVEAMQRKIGVKDDGKWGDSSVTAYNEFMAKQSEEKSEEKQSIEPTPQEAGFVSSGGDDPVGYEKDINEYNSLTPAAKSAFLKEYGYSTGELNGTDADFGRMSMDAEDAFLAGYGPSGKRIATSEDVAKFTPSMWEKAGSFFGMDSGIPDAFKAAILNPENVKSHKVLKEAFNCDSEAECALSANRFQEHLYGKGYNRWSNSGSSWHKDDYMVGRGGDLLYKTDTPKPAETSEVFANNRADVQKLAEEGKLQRGDTITMDRKGDTYDKKQGFDRDNKEGELENTGAEHTMVYMGRNEKGEVMVAHSSDHSKTMNIVPLKDSDIVGKVRLTYTPQSVIRGKDFKNSEQYVRNAWKEYQKTGRFHDGGILYKK